MPYVRHSHILEAASAKRLEHVHGHWRCWIGMVRVSDELVDESPQMTSINVLHMFHVLYLMMAQPSLVKVIEEHAR